MVIDRDIPTEEDTTDWADKYADHIHEKHGHDKIKMLTIAASLLVAEIERLQRETESMTEDQAFEFMFDYGNVGRSPVDLKTTTPEYADLVSAKLKAASTTRRPDLAERAFNLIVEHFKLEKQDAKRVQ